MKTLFMMAMLVITFETQCQIVHRDSLVGTWTCTSVTFLEGKVYDDLRSHGDFDTMSRKMFLDAKFTFTAGGIFNLAVSKDAPPAAQDLKFLNNKKWIFDANRKRISIGPSENLMDIDVKEDQGEVYFHLPETPMKLTMKKR